MSLALYLRAPDFIVLACDGRSSLRCEDGSLIPVSEDSFKFRVVAPEVVVMATGSNFVSRSVFEAAERFASSRRDDASLFRLLASHITDELAFAVQTAEEEIEGYEGTALMLLGLDRETNALRVLYWPNGETNFVEDDSTAAAIGNEQAVPMAIEILTEIVQRG